jgi:hypothetical protein
MGVSVPKEKLGEFVEWAILHGVEGGFQLINPIFDKPPPRPKQIAADKPQALPPPNGHRAPATHQEPAQAVLTRPPEMSQIEWLYHLISAKQPIDREAIGQHADRAGMTVHRVTDALRQMKVDRMVVTDGRAFRLGPTPPKFNAARAAAPVKARTGPEPAPGTQSGIVLDFIRKGNGEPVSYSAIAEHFKKKGIDHRNVGVSTTELTRRGFIRRSSRAHYVPA